MDPSPEAISQLQSFGITLHAARAYVALLDVGVGDARAVSERAKVPSSKVYAALAQLERAGLAESTRGKPRAFTAVPMEAFLARRLAQEEEHVAELRARRKEIADLFPVGEGAAVVDRPRTVSVTGKRNVMQHVREACRGATRTILVLRSPGLRADLTFRRPFEEASRRGVDVRVSEEPPTEERLPNAAVVATFDGRTALLLRFTPGRARDAEASAIETTDEGLVRPMRVLLESYRDAAPASGAASATPPREACAIVHAADARELMRDRIWLAIRAASRARLLLSPTTPRPIDPALRAQLPTGVEVRLLPRASAVAFAVLDGRRALLATARRGARERRDVAYATVADDAVVRAFEAQFEAYWAAATPYQR